MHHWGGAGATTEELERLSRKPLDMLLVPLQGHTNIFDKKIKERKDECDEPESRRIETQAIQDRGLECPLYPDNMYSLVHH
jgi:hypothetical protein